MREHKPVICTLTDGERNQRATHWHDVVRRYATSIREDPNGFTLVLRDGEHVFETIRDLVEAERRCCQWMNLELNREKPVSLTITAESKEGKAAIGAMLLQSPRS